MFSSGRENFATIGCVALYTDQPPCYIFLPYRHLNRHLKRWQRQAAGPLTENLPNVCLVNDLQVLTDGSNRTAVRASRKETLHQGTLSRLSSRWVCFTPCRLFCMARLF